MIYYSLLLYIYFVAILCFYHKNKLKIKNKKIFLLLSFFALICISGFRSINVGVDTANYYDHYEIISNTSIMEICSTFRFNSIEIGYNLLAKICSVCVSDYIFFQFIVSTICGVGMMHFIYNNVDNVLIGVITYLGLGLYLFELNLSRQMLAVIFVINAWDYLIKGKRNICLLFLFIACSFHITSIIFVLLFIIYFFRNSKQVYKLIIIGIFISVMNYEYIITLARRFFPIFKNYYVNEKAIQQVGSVMYIWLGIIIVAFTNIMKNNDKKQKMISVYSLIYVACNLIGMQFNSFERIGLYFLPFVIPMLDNSKYIFQRKYQRFFYLIMIIVLFSVMFIIRASTSQYQYSFYY